MNVLDKIAKCLRLAKSSNPHEAAAALRQAQALMAKHDVSERDVELAAIAEQRVTAAGKPRAGWIMKLSALIDRAFGVDSMIDGDGYRFIGLPTRVEIATYAFTVLRRQLTRDRQAYYKTLRGKRVNRIRRADLFALAWIDQVARTVEAFAMPAKERELMGQYMQRYDGKLSTHTARNPNVRRDNMADAIIAGRRAAADVRLHHGVNGDALKALEYFQ